MCIFCKNLLSTLLPNNSRGKVVGRQEGGGEHRLESVLKNKSYFRINGWYSVAPTLSYYCGTRSFQDSLIQIGLELKWKKFLNQSDGTLLNDESIIFCQYRFQQVQFEKTEEKGGGTVSILLASSSSRPFLHLSQHHLINRSRKI